jgi:DnaJ-class molecular chaperone
MASQRDYYQLLGVKRDATAADIRKAYRRLARQYHPDVNQSPEAVQRFSEISEAHEVLSDEEKRKSYDRFGHAGVGAGRPDGAPPGGGFHTSWSSDAPGAGGSTADFGSIFEQMFGGAGGAPFGAGAGPGVGPTPRGAPRPTRGEDMKHRITVSFMTAAIGGQEQVHLRTGGGVQTLTVTIPPGMEDEGKLRLKGRGQASLTGGPAGDLIIIVKVGHHPWFRREGLDLLIDVPVSIAEAALGTTVEVPLLDGSVTMKIPAGASSDRKLRIKGKGIDDGKGRVGDFYVVVQIAAPEELTEPQRRILEDLAAGLKNPRESGPWADATSDGA